MWVRILVAGLLLLLAGQLLAGVGADDEARTIRDLRSGDGVRVTGTVVELFEWTRQERSGRRGRRTVEITCPEYRYRLDGRPRRFRDHDTCDGVEVGDTMPLIVDPADPGRAYPDTDAHLADLSGDTRAAWGFRIAGGLVTALGLALAARRSTGRRQRPT